LSILKHILSTMRSMRWNWQKLFSYAEVVCFVSAWAVGLLVAAQGQRSEQARVATRSLTTTSDVFGVQATLSR
jgi:hypothetical protein